MRRKGKHSFRTTEPPVHVSIGGEYRGQYFEKSKPTTEVNVWVVGGLDQSWERI